MNFMALREGTTFLMSMASFWKKELERGETDIIDSPIYRKLHFESLARQAAREAVWKLGHDFYYGGLHGYKID